MSSLQIEVHVRRGSVVESRHLVQAAISDPAGSITACTEHGDRVTTFRSSAKPFQLLSLVERGHAERWGLSDEQLAVMVASHTGSVYHRELVAGLLRRFGCSEADLACGYHEPLDPEALAEVRAHPERRSALFNNCSGKHAGMLGLARSEGWPTQGYERAEHPVQQLMHRTVAEACGIPSGALEVAVDDCGVSVFALPLAAMARGYARLAAASASGDRRERALQRIRQAMAAHPRATGGPGRFSSLLIEATRGRLVAKGGAEGLECMAVTTAGLGIAVKVEDGQTRAAGPAVIALLEHLGMLEPEERTRLGSARRPLIFNPAGLEVGSIEGTVSLSPAPAAATIDRS
jgi:L-asparaginase II